MKGALAVVALAACGSPPAAVDARPADSPVDTFSPPVGDAPAGAVTIRVTRGGAPLEGLGVYFQNADSTLVKAVLTDDQGAAFSALASGGFVTVQERRGGNLFELSTFTNVQDGEQLELEFDPAGSKDLINLTLQVPLDTGPGVESYRVNLSCGEELSLDATGRGTIGIAGCGGITDVVVQSIDGVGNPLRGFHAQDVVLSSDAVILSGTYGPVADLEFQIANVPAGWVQVGVTQTLSATRHAFSASNVVDRTGTAANIAVRTPPADANPLFTTLQYPTPSEIGRQIVHEWTAGPLATYSLDLATSLLPRFTAAPRYGVENRRLAWLEDPSPVAPNFVRAKISVTRDAIPEARTWRWSIVGGHDGPSIEFPVLPIGEFDYNAQATDVITIAELTTAKLPDLAAFHRRGFANVLTAIAGTSGKLVVQTLNPPEL